MKPQKAQNLDRDQLDEAIDATAARMTAVADDDSLALHIVSSLPERSAWAAHGWIARFAIGALATIAILVVLRSFDDRSTTVLRTESSVVASPTIVEPASNDRRTAVEPPLMVRRTIVEPSPNVRRTIVDVDRPDHEFSLPAINAVAALGVDALLPASLPEDAPLAIESLEIADLALPTGSISPR